VPVHALGTPLLHQAVIENPNSPWRPVGEPDAVDVIEAIREKGPAMVALSAHDSTFQAFSRVIGSRYTTIRVGHRWTWPQHAR